jgi:hypothetical protein
MNNYLLPSNDEFVEKVAKAMAKKKFQLQASKTISGIIGTEIKNFYLTTLLTKCLINCGVRVQRMLKSKKTLTWPMHG